MIKTINRCCWHFQPTDAGGLSGQGKDWHKPGLSQSILLSPKNACLKKTRSKQKKE
jgi:hypothetical protein